MRVTLVIGSCGASFCAESRATKPLVPKLPFGNALVFETPFRPYGDCRHSSTRITGDPPASHSWADENRQCPGAAINPRFTGYYVYTPASAA